MFSNGKLIIFFILLKYTSFMKFLLAENNIYITYESYNTNTSNGINNVTTIQTPNATTTGNDKFLYMAKIFHPEYNTKTPRIENKLQQKQQQQQQQQHDTEFDDKKSITERYESLPQPEAVFGGKYYPYQTKQQQEIFHQQQIPAATQDTGGLPVFPERTDAVYFIVAVIGGAKSWGRTLARTLLDMGPPFGSPMGPPLRPLYVDLPQNKRFSVKVLMSLCQQGDGIPLAGIVVIGDGQSARAVALSGNAMNVPVLWAKGGKANIYATNRETQSSLQAMLEPSAREILGAIRSLFLQAHWHSFFVLSDVEATMVLNSPEGALLREPPLQSKILPLLAGKGDVFRQLAEISRSTRGIVLLLCNLDSARKIMTEAKRLNMAGGHFIWLWADTSSTTEFFDLHQSNHHDDKIVEYPDAVKEFSGEDFDEGHHTMPKYVEDLVASKMDYDDLNTEQRNKIAIKSTDKDKSREDDELHLSQQQREQQIYYPTNTRQSNGAGRYIFGLNHNGGDSIETKSNKEKRNRKGFLKGLILHSEIQGYSGELIGANYDSKQKSLGLDYETFDQVELSDEKMFDHSDYVDRSMEITNNNNNNNKNNNSSYSWLPVFNESEHTENRNVKLKRTSQYYESNSNNSHVLFHHFKDFPVGLLALRPIKMPIDRSFIRSTLRLFASTWAKVDQEMTQSENFHQMSWSRNPYEFDKIKYFRDRDHHQRSLFIYHKRRRRQILHYNKTVNKNFSIPVNVRTSSSNISNKEYVQFNAQNITNYSIENSSYNQNLSGLTSSNQSNESNTFPRRSIPYTRNNSKRYNTWWSAVVKDSAVRIKHSQPSIGLNSNAGDRYRKSVSYYRGGCFGSASRQDIKRAETFAGVLREATALALAGQKILDGNFEKPLITSFELLNLVPDENGGKSNVLMEAAFDRRRGPRKPLRQFTKWRKVGLISGTKVQLDTIVWPGGDIMVSGMSARARPVFRVVTALAPPFVMEAEQDEDGLCLRGLPCQRLSPNIVHNLTLMFNAIETRGRLKENTRKIDGRVLEADTSSYDYTLYQTKCCYGLSMDLLDNIATELGFEFHLYLVQDELFGTKFHTTHSSHAETHDDLEFSKRRQSHRREKLHKQYTEEPFLSKHHQPRQTRNYHSASFERETIFRVNGDEDFKRRTDDDEEEVTVGEWNGENYKPSSKENNKIGDNNEKHFSRKFSGGKVKWNGIIGDLISGSADMSFAPLSVSRARAEVIDFSAPYFYSGVSWLAAPQSKSEIPLLAFLLPFSPELWIAIFTSLNVTAIAVAIYEWLSPFGLNPWGRQRSKNFSMSSALWVMWGLLCGHLVAFKAPKSWPNKFLINVWGGFSVIFIASYTANIAALIAGLFFHNASNRPDVALLAQRVGAPAASAAESYIKEDQHLWEHMKKFKLKNIDDGIRGLKNGTLDLLLGDTPILDYYRATDPGCTLQRIGDSFVEDTYAVGMSKGFPLKDSISAIIAKYSSNGYLDILTEKWYGELPCFKLHNDIVQPRPLGVEAVAGVFLLLGLGVILGVLILIFEHLFYKYTLPILRHKPKGTIWKSRNIMFFSQKLYRFINCVELVSPHHAARELVHTLRQGQIASLFQKSIKRKEDEQRRRRKSKAQFFEMIQEIRRVQQQERANPKLEVVTELEPSTGKNAEPTQKPRASPKSRLFANRKDSRSRSNSSTLNVRRFSTDSILSDRLDSIGRRLSRDLTNSPPDFVKRFDGFGKNNTKKFDTFSGGRNLSKEKIEETKFDTFSGKDFDRYSIPVKKYINKRVPLNSDRFSSQEHIEIDNDTKLKSQSIPNDDLVEPIYQDTETTIKLRNRLHHELRSKYGNESATEGVSSLYAQVQKQRPKDQTAAQQHHHRQRSLDGLDARPPIPIPMSRNSQNDLESMETQTQLLPPKNQLRSNLKQISLDRLSREDLLKLSESSQTEIHEYLSKSSRESQGEPP